MLDTRIESPNQARATAWLASAVFIALLSLPGLSALAGSTSETTVEQRTPRPFPSTAVSALAGFPQGFERWFDDRFGLRAELVREANLLRLGLGVSPSPTVVVGRGGFFFYDSERSLEQYRRTLRLSGPERAEWRAILEERRAWLAARGIRYLVFFPPNKETIYPDAMPEDIPRAQRSSLLDQLLSGLEVRSEVAAVDLRPPLVRARKTERVYHLTDSHWNDAGAFVAAREVIERLHGWFPALPLLSEASVVRTPTEIPGGDLAGMMGLPGDLPEPTVRVVPAEPRAREVDPGLRVREGLAPHQVPRAREVPDPLLPRAVFLGDSFLMTLVPLLAEHFERSVFVGGHEFDPGWLERERPDVVVECWLERLIIGGPPENPEELRAGGAGRTEPRL